MYSSLNINRAIKLRNLSWRGHVEQMEEIRNVYIIPCITEHNLLNVSSSDLTASNTR
jgi:hypothetical protein